MRSFPNEVTDASAVKRSAVMRGLVAVIVGVALFTTPIHAQNNQRTFECSDRTIQGTYGGQVQGTRSVPPALGGGTELVVGVVIRTYDGFGNFSQIDNVKGSVTGITPDRPGSGTYVVSSNCTATTFFNPAPGVVIEEKLVILQFGSELRSMVLTPPGVMVTATAIRVGSTTGPVDRPNNID
jgi:hypothetical protein